MAAVVIVMQGVAHDASTGVQIGHELLAAAGRANTATCTVSLAERRSWFSDAARMFYNSPEGVTIAARCLLTSLRSKYTYTTCYAH